MPIAVPQRQIENARDRNPLQRAFGVVRMRRAGEPRDQKDEAEPILALLAETRPADGASQLHIDAVDAGFLVNFPAHTSDDVFVALHLSAQSVVLAQMLIV